MSIVGALPDGSLGTRHELETDYHPSNLVVTDQNGDGVKDLLSSSTGSPRLTLFLGNGHRDFTPRYTTLPRVAGPVLAIDFDSDGIPDGVTASGDARVVALQGTPNGFEPASVQLPVGPNPSAIVGGDFTRPLPRSGDRMRRVDRIHLLLGAGNGDSRT